MPKRVTKLCLRGFRGATKETQLDFDDKPVTLIYGENGCGKTSIVDAIDFVCNGNVGSLDERSISTNKWECLVSKPGKASDLSVSIEFDKKTYSAKLGKKAADRCDTRGRPTAHILRKTQILRIIDAQPAKRYEAIRDLVEIPELVASENSLRSAIKHTTQNLEEAVRGAIQAEDTLQIIWKAEGEHSGDFRAWAEALTKNDISTKRVEIQQVNDILNPFRECERDIKSLDDNLTVANQWKNESEKNLELLSQAETKSAADGSSLVKLVQDAYSLLAKTESAKNCPVCESTIERDSLLERLAERLKKLEQITELVRKKDLSVKQHSDAMAVVTNARNKFITSAKKLHLSVAKKQFPEIDSIKLKSPQWKDLAIEVSANNLDEVSEQARELFKCVAEVVLELEEKRANLSKAIDQHNAVKTNLSSLDEKKSIAEGLDKTVKALNAMLSIYERHRKEHVNGRLDGISSKVEDLYQALHPGEELGKAKFYLSPNKKGSLEYHGHFLGEEEVQLQAYYSDSHLDTLGICVFLALAECHDNENMVIVLDDVISSVDQLHTERFIDVMHNYAKKFKHLIMTTHFRPLKDRYLYARGPVGNVQIIELLTWTKERGIVHTKTKVKAERLEELLENSPLERETVAAQAGILLENLLDFITLQYQCKMPRTSESSYSLASLIQGIDKRLANALKTTKCNGTEIVTELKTILDSINGLGWIRNQVGCHFSLRGMSISEHDVREFAKLTIQLSKALICASCGELPRKSKSGSDWECRCGEIHLAPLVIPGQTP